MNPAAELGPSKFAWWQDWRGECCAIVAGGPSVKAVGVELLRNRIHVIAVKESVDLCPWADVVYGCDGAWWRHRKGMSEFRGLKIAYDPRACTEFGLQKIHIENASTDKMLFDEPGMIGSGGNSGFQAANLAAQFGATGILMIGFDMEHTNGGAHWYGRNNWLNCSNPLESNFKRWRTAFRGSAHQLKTIGIDVVDASPNGKLDCFRKRSIGDAMNDWGLA